MNNTITPDAIPVVRSVCDLTQQQLADLVNVDRSHIARIENGSRRLTPALRARIELAVGLDDPELQDAIAAVQRWRITNG